MAGVEVCNIANEDALMFQELLSLKARLATQLSASKEPRWSFDSSTLLECAKFSVLHANVMQRDMTEVVIDDGVAFIKGPGIKGGLRSPNLPGNKARCGWTQNSSRCEAGNAIQGDSSRDDGEIHALHELRLKLAIRLAETSPLVH